MFVTIFVPISRDTFLQELFTSLEMLKCDTNHTSLLIYVDSHDKKLYEKCRVYTDNSKFGQKLCVFRKSNKKVPRYSVDVRKFRIAELKNESTEYIANCDYVFGIEDDTIVPRNALEKLLKNYQQYPNAGFISGVEMGRWGAPYVGAWKADDIYQTKCMTSLMPADGIQEVDCAGFYCYLTKYQTYMQHNYEPFMNGVLGPDTNFGIALRQQGLKNYVDWSIKCKHYNDGGQAITFDNTQPIELEYKQVEGGNRFRQNIIKQII